MKKRYTEEQVVRILKEASVSGKVDQTCRKYGIHPGTLYNWRKKYDGMEVSDVKKLRGLEEENRRLKRIVADKELDIDALRSLLEKYGEAR